MHKKEVTAYLVENDLVYYDAVSKYVDHAIQFLREHYNDLSQIGFAFTADAMDNTDMEWVIPETAEVLELHGAAYKVVTYEGDELEKLYSFYYHREMNILGQYNGDVIDLKVNDYRWAFMSLTFKDGHFEVLPVCPQFTPVNLNGVDPNAITRAVKESKATTLH